MLGCVWLLAACCECGTDGFTGLPLQVDRCVKLELQKARPSDGEELWHRYRPSYIRAFSDAADAAPDRHRLGAAGGTITGDDVVTKREFRVLLSYLRLYAIMYEVFAMVDGMGAGVTLMDDKKLSREEWSSMIGAVVAAGTSWAPFVALQGASAADFDALDLDGQGSVMLSEFCGWVVAAEKAAGTAVGWELAIGEADHAWHAEAETAAAAVPALAFASVVPAVSTASGGGPVAANGPATAQPAVAAPPSLAGPATLDSAMSDLLAFSKNDFGKGTGPSTALQPPEPAAPALVGATTAVTPSPLASSPEEGSADGPQDGLSPPPRVGALANPGLAPSQPEAEARLVAEEARRAILAADSEAAAASVERQKRLDAEKAEFAAEMAALAASEKQRRGSSVAGSPVATTGEAPALARPALDTAMSELMALSRMDFGRGVPPRPTAASSGKPARPAPAAGAPTVVDAPPDLKVADAPASSSAAEAWRAEQQALGLASSSDDDESEDGGEEESEPVSQIVAQTGTATAPTIAELEGQALQPAPTAESVESSPLDSAMVDLMNFSKIDLSKRLPMPAVISEQTEKAEVAVAAPAKAVKEDALSSVEGANSAAEQEAAEAKAAAAAKTKADEVKASAQEELARAAAAAAMAVKEEEAVVAAANLLAEQKSATAKTAAKAKHEEEKTAVAVKAAEAAAVAAAEFAAKVKAEEDMAAKAKQEEAALAKAAADQVKADETIAAKAKEEAEAVAAAAAAASEALKELAAVELAATLAVAAEQEAAAAKAAADQAKAAAEVKADE